MFALHIKLSVLKGEKLFLLKFLPDLLNRTDDANCIVLFFKFFSRHYVIGTRTLYLFIVQPVCDGSRILVVLTLLLVASLLSPPLSEYHCNDNLIIEVNPLLGAKSARRKCRRTKAS